MLTIGQLAAFAQVSVRTVHHYHRIGLLPEPERDHSGYRRYRSADLIRLLRIRTLAELGIPLARIGELLEGSPEHLRTAIDELDRQLQMRQEAIARQRAALAATRAGDPRHPPSLAAVAERLSEWGISSAGLNADRDAHLLAEALVGRPQLTAITDGVVGDTWRQAWAGFDALRDAPADDPRVADLAAQIELALRAGMPDLPQQPTDPLIELMMEDFVDSLPPAHAAVVRAVGASFGQDGRQPSPAHHPPPT